MGAAVHFTSLDGVRGISAQVVFAAHLIAAGGALGHILGWSARVAVIVFFVLSGFVITSSIRRQFSFVHYARRRVMRIYPPYLAAIAISWAVFVLCGFGSVSWSEMARALVFLTVGSDALTQMDGPLWSLRLEVICYAIAGLVACRSAPTFALAICLAVATAAKLAFGLQALVWFGVGSVAAILGARTWMRHSVVCAGSLFVIGLPLTLHSAFAFGASDTIPAAALQAALSACVAGWIVRLSVRPVRVLSSASWLGSYAYTLYVIHAPLLILTTQLGIPLPVAFFAIQCAAFAIGQIAEPGSSPIVREAGRRAVRALNG